MSELLKNAPSENHKEQLKTLQLSIFKNAKEFQTLVNKPEVKSWMKKIFDKTVQKSFAEEFKQYEKLNIQKDLTDILKKNPQLWFYVSGTLGLPIKSQTFSTLTNQQKLNFISLKKALNPGKIQTFLTKKGELFSARHVIERTDLYRKNQAEDLDSSFKWANLSNFWNLEKTLKTDFWLTNAETLQCMNYLKFIQKNPQFISPDRAYQVEAGTGANLVFLWVGVLLWALGYHFISSLGKISLETNIYNGRTQIENPENILKLLTQEAKFSKDWVLEKKMFAKEENDGLLLSLGKDVINRAQSKTVQMQLTGKLALQYDLQKFCKMEIDHSTGTLHLTLPKPNLIVLESQAMVLNKSNEWIQLKEFDNAEMELQEKLKKDAINDAMNQRGFLEQAQEQTKAQLFNLMKAFKPYGVEIKKIEMHEAKTIDVAYPKG